jgi:hypothetical protein
MHPTCTEPPAAVFLLRATESENTRPRHPPGVPAAFATAPQAERQGEPGQGREMRRHHISLSHVNGNGIQEAPNRARENPLDPRPESPVESVPRQAPRLERRGSPQYLVTRRQTMERERLALDDWPRIHRPGKMASGLTRAGGHPSEHPSRVKRRQLTSLLALIQAHPTLSRGPVPPRQGTSLVRSPSASLGLRREPRANRKGIRERPILQRPRQCAQGTGSAAHNGSSNPNSARARSLKELSCPPIHILERGSLRRSRILAVHRNSKERKSCPQGAWASPGARSSHVPHIAPRAP